jgi:D-cysteine desulfhydrase
MSPDFPLYRRFPKLAETLPRVALGAGPSPVHRLGLLSAETGSEIWIKNDGLYGSGYGGNKPRKLEFLLAEALSEGRDTVLTAGAPGTHHGLATAHYCSQLGLRTVLVLAGPLKRGSIEALEGLGATVHYHRQAPAAALLAPWYMLRYASRRPFRLPYTVPPGGSSPLGAAGYVNAGLELGEQVQKGELPEPSEIVLAVGTGGTAAGLLLGLRLAGLHSRLTGVAVTRAPTAWRLSVLLLARRTARLLARRGADPALASLRLDGLSIESRFLGAGYGKPARAAARAMQAMRDAEGIRLEPTYTAKAAAALLEREGAGRARPVLYWHTYDALSAAAGDGAATAAITAPYGFAPRRTGP